MKRKLIPLTVLVLALASCSSTSSQSASPSSEATGEAITCPGGSAVSTASKPYNIALVTGDNHDPFYVTLNHGAQAMAKRLGVTVNWQGPQVFEAQQQIPILDAVLASKPDFLAVAPTDVQALIGPMKQFKDAGIAVLAVDTDVSDASVRLGSITSDNKLGGEVAAKYLNEELGGKGKVLYIGPQPGVFTTDERLKGFEEALKNEYPGLTFLEPQFDNDDPVQAASMVSAVLQRDPDLAGIFASDTLNGQGAATAIQGAGLTGKVKIVAFDAQPDQVAAVKRGLVQALVVQKAYSMGENAVLYGVCYLEGDKAIPALTTPDYVIATKENIDDPEIMKYMYQAE